jgi:hypothetical protein
MFGVPLGGWPFIVNDLGNIGSAQTVLTVTHPHGRRRGACHGDVVPSWSTATA